MPDKLTIQIASQFDAQGVTAARKEIEALARAAQQGGGADKATQQAALAYQKLATEAQKTATEVQKTALVAGQAAAADQRLATEVQKTAAASNQAAIAAQRLATEQQRTAVSAAQAEAAQSRAAQAAMRLAQAQIKAAQGVSQSSSGLSKYAQEFGQAFQSNLLGIVGPAAAATAALAALKGAGDLAQLGAQAMQTRQAFDGLAQQAGTSGNALMTALRSASKGGISDLNLQLAANRAQLLGVADSAGEFSTLMEIARDRAQKMGISTSQAFNDLVTGLGRGSPLILDNLGITVSVTQANEQYAASLGKTAAQLTEAEQKQALINAVLAQGQASIAATGGAAETTAATFERVGASAENAQAALGKVLAILLQMPLEKFGVALQWVAEGLNNLAGADDGLEQIAARTIEASQSYDDYLQKQDMVNAKLAKIGVEQSAVTESQYNFARSLIASGQGAEEAYGALEQYGTVVQAGMSASAAWGEQSTELANQMIALAGSSETNRIAVESLAGQYNAGGISGDTLRTSIAALTAQQQANEAAALAQGQAQQAAAAGADTSTQAVTVLGQQLDQATVKAQIDAVQSEELALRKTMLAQQAQVAAQALLASGQAGAVTAAKLASSSNLVDVLTAAYYRLAAAQAAAGAAQAKAQIQAGRDQATARLVAQGDAYKRLRDAKEQEILQTGTAAQKQALYNSQLERARNTYGEQSEQFVKARTALTQYQQQQEKSTGRGGGKGSGKAPRVTDAEKAGDQLSKIERDTGDKIAAIDRATQDKLIALDQAAAEKRAAAARKLADDIAASNADLVAQQEADDLDLVGAKDDELKKLQAREQAQAKARQATLDAQRAAQEEAANGDAETAQKVLDQRERQIAAQERIDQQYYEKQQELAGNPEQLAILQQQYDEATAANATAAETRIGLARAEAAQKAAAAQQERDQIIASAEEQKAQVIGKAYEQAMGVKKASDDQRAAVVGNLGQQASAINSWASSMETASARVIRSADNAKAAIAGIPAPASGGGSASTGVSSGGGVPASGSGASAAPAAQASRPGAGTQSAGRTVGGQSGPQSRGGAPPGQPGNTPGTGTGGGAGSGGNAGQVLAEANEVIRQIVAAGTIDKKTLSSLERYQDSIATAVATLSRVADLRAQLARPDPPITIEQIRALAEETRQVTTLLIGSIPLDALRQLSAVTKWSDISGKAIEVITRTAELRERMAQSQQPLNPAVIAQMAAESTMIANAVTTRLLPTAEATIKGVQRWAEYIAAVVEPLQSVADLREALADPQPPLSGRQIEKLAAEAQGAAYLMSKRVLPLTVAQAEAAQRYAETAGALISALRDVADLRESLAEPAAPLTRAQIEKLAAEAQGITYLVSRTLLPTTEEQVGAIQRYADAAGAAIELLGRVADLRETLTDPQPPLTATLARQLAAESRMALDALAGVLAPTTEEEAQALERYAQASGAAIDALRGAADLREAAATLGPPLTAADMQRLANEGRMALDALGTVAVPVAVEQAEAAQRYADAVGAAVSALKAPLELSGALFADYVSPSDAQLDLLASDAGRVADRVLAAAAVYDSKGLEAGKAYAEAVGGTFGAFKEGMLFFSALESGDFALDQGKLAQFESGVTQALATMGRVGALAAQIPPANLTALNASTAALGQASETMIQLSAVPFGNLAQAVGTLGGGSGGGGATTTNYFNNTFMLPSGTTQQMAGEIMQIIQRQMGARR